MDKQAAGKVREVLETLIMKVLPKEEQGAFKALNQQWGLTQDIKRIYSAGGGEGKGSASGFLRPSKIEEEAGRGPTTSATDDAARLINKFKVRDHDVEDIGGPSLGTLARDAIQATIGKVGNMFDASAVRSNPAAKHMIEGLRASVQRTPSTAYQNKDEGQEPIYAP
jgi:hypothetical protein